MKTLFLSIILLLQINWLTAQDIIYKKDGGLINCKISEIRVDLIKYKRVDLKESPVFEIKKEEIWKIKYKNGEIGRAHV